MTSLQRGWRNMICLKSRHEHESARKSSQDTRSSRWESTRGCFTTRARARRDASKATDIERDLKWATSNGLDGLRSGMWGLFGSGLGSGSFLRAGGIAGSGRPEFFGEIGSAATLDGGESIKDVSRSRNTSEATAETTSMAMDGGGDEWRIKDSSAGWGMRKHGDVEGASRRHVLNNSK